MTNKILETYSNLVQILDYSDTTGEFYWKVPPEGKDIKTGDVAGRLEKRSGYIRLTYQYETYSMHRLAWLFVYGVLPTLLIDHINGDKTDNRICNLREVDHSTNMHNKQRAHKNNQCGLLGVTALSNGRFTARLQVNKISTFLGYFKTAEEAHLAYLAFKNKNTKIAVSPGQLNLF